MKISISRRIKRAMLGLTLITCLVFVSINLVLVYVIEDSVFIKTLRSENQVFEKLAVSDRQGWQPENRHMKFYTNETDLPDELQSLLGSDFGVYEYFKQDSAKFVLYEKLDDEPRPYFITYDVSQLLAVRSARTDLFLTVLIVSLIIMFVALIVAHFLARQVLNPLKKLTAQFDNSDDEFPHDFAHSFYGDEVGVLAKKLEAALIQVQLVAQREYEFNRGISHELRTPIQVAKNSVELLELQSQYNTHNGSKLLSRLQRSVTKMQQLTEVFLWLSSTQQKTSNEVSLMVCVERLKKEYIELFPQHKIVIESASIIKLSLPEGALTVVIDNMLRNAVQHGSGKMIRCILTESCIQIENDISDKHGSKNPSSGHGIGLTIVQRICERLGWKVAIPNDSIGKYVIQVRLQ